MANLHALPPARKESSATSIFIAGLPDRCGRILTASSQIDSWRHKNPAILKRLELERAVPQKVTP